MDTKADSVISVMQFYIVQIEQPLMGKIVKKYWKSRKAKILKNGARVEDGSCKELAMLEDFVFNNFSEDEVNGYCDNTRMFLKGVQNLLDTLI